MEIMKVNEPERQKLGQGIIFWQWLKHICLTMLLVYDNAGLVITRMTEKRSMD